jgi:enediyne biosynthesis protein E4
VCNDEYWNFLFRNEGAGKFKEQALAAGVSCNFAGDTVSGMGADAADYDHDGRLDLFVTDFREQNPILYKNLGGGVFEDATMHAGAAAGSFPYIKWGCGFVDFDNDGHPDLFIGCGHLGEYAGKIDLALFREADEVSPILLRNTGDGRFVNVSDSSGDGMRAKLVARGIAFDDLDNDGRVDVVILNSRRPPTLLRNESQTGNHWIGVRLEGVKTNRDGVGARLKVVADDLVQIDEVHSGRGYQSHWGSRLHFGLGKHDRIDRIEVRWIGGGVDVLENLPVDRLLTIREGSNETHAAGRSLHGEIERLGDAFPRS